MLTLYVFSADSIVIPVSVFMHIEENGISGSNFIKFFPIFYPGGRQKANPDWNIFRTFILHCLNTIFL